MLSLQKRHFSLFSIVILVAFTLLPKTSFALSCPLELPQLTEQNTYSPQNQTFLLCYLKEIVKERQAGKVYSHFGATVDRHFERCASQINQTTLNRSEANGLLKSCLAQFNNGHIRVNLRNTPPIRLPFQILFTRGKYLVKSTFPRESCLSENSLQRGDEILSIDGIPIENLATDFLSYQSKSSSAARKQAAVSALTYRNYLYPEQPSTKIRVKRNGEILNLKENYYFFQDSFSEDQTNELTEKGISPCVRDQEQPHRGRGYYSSRSLYPSTWTAFASSSFINEIASFSKNVGDLPENTCYLRLKNFNHEDVFLSSGEELDLWEQIEVEIDQCKYEQKKLILDMRANKGGAYRRLTKLLNVLVPAHSNNGLEYRSLKVEHSFTGTYHCDFENFDQGFQGLNLAAFSSTFCQTLEINPMWLEGYAQDILVLTSPLCKSSCDLLTRTLKTLPNVTLIGTPTEGAMNGVSFYQGSGLSSLQYSSFLSLYFDDATTMVMKPGASDSSNQFCNADGNHCYEPIEGQPVHPHVIYQPGIEDMTERPFGSGFRRKIEENLAGTL